MTVYVVIGFEENQTYLFDAYFNEKDAQEACKNHPNTTYVPAVVK